MSEDIRNVKCARCNCSLHGPANPTPDDRFVCPNCGEEDTLQNVLSEVGEGVKEQVVQQLGRLLQDTFRGSKHFKVTPHAMPKGERRLFSKSTNND